LQIIERTHVNIYDFIEADRIGAHVHVFHTENELATYTRKTEQFFPRINAVAGGLLQFLLRRIFNPEASKRGGRSREEIA
jgi:hypothetical protein